VTRAPGKTFRQLLVLHPAFALTGIFLSVNGPLLPSLASTFHLIDSESGLLIFLFFAGTSVGATLCRGNYARLMTVGFLLTVACCLGIAVADRTFVFPLFFLLGISIGLPLSTVSLFVGRNFAERCAPTLTFLNFTWSAGALGAPLLVAPLLARHYGFRAAYLGLAAISLLAALGCGLLLEDNKEEAVRPVQPVQGLANLRLIVLFALMAFLEVGIEDTAVAWLATYSLRSSGGGLAAAAASSSLYWCGFLASRGISSLLLLRVAAMRVLYGAVGIALSAAVLLASFPTGAGRGVAMILLGSALAPIFPLVLSTLFARARNTADARWAMAFAGFGGSALPLVTGWISARSGSLRLGLITVPISLLIMGCLLLASGNKPPSAAE
jgi:fucose permease